MAEDRLEPDSRLRLVLGRGRGASGYTTRPGLESRATDAPATSPTGSADADPIEAAHADFDAITRPVHPRPLERKLELPLAERPAPPSFREIAEFIELWRLRSQAGRPARPRPRSTGTWWRLGGRAS